MINLRQARDLSMYMDQRSAAASVAAFDVTPTALTDAKNGLLPLGHLNPGFDYRIMDDEGLIVAAGELGELWLSGSGVGLGYINKPDMTKKALKNIVGEDGAIIKYYKTGDLVRELANGLGLELEGVLIIRLKSGGIELSWKKLIMQL